MCESPNWKTRRGNLLLLGVGAEMTVVNKFSPSLDMVSIESTTTKSEFVTLKDYGLQYCSFEIIKIFECCWY